MKRLILPSALLLGALTAPACSDATKHPTGGAPQGGSNSAGRNGNGILGDGAAEHAAGSDGGGASSVAGQAASAAAGEGGFSAAGEGGSGTLGQAGNAPEPLPPVGDPPICAQKRSFGAGAALAISAAGDDLLQGVTPDELHIAWKNGDAFYVADRATTADAFGTPIQVVGGSALQSVTLRGDGLSLIAIRNREVIRMARDAGSAFDVAVAISDDFELFDGTLRVIPVGGQNLRDAVLSPSDDSFFYSYFLNSGTGSQPTLQESRRDAGFWDFANLDLGELLYADGEKRRIPTGVASDSLTLFYRDEVNGDFRAAWRVNTMVQFKYSEVVSVADGVTAAAPNGACSKLYFSAPGAAGLDLFVSSATP